MNFSLQIEFSVWQFSVRTNVVSFTSASKPSFKFLFSLSKRTFCPQMRKVWKSKSLSLFFCLALPYRVFQSSVLSCRSRKAKSQKSFPLKSARNCPPVKVVRSQKSVKTEKSFHVEKRTVRQRLFIRKTLSSCFLHWPITTEAMGLGGLRANFLSQ